MSTVALTSNAFGEVSPAFQGRRDLPVFLQGMSWMSNWIPYSLGGMIYRPGFWYIGNMKFNETGVLKRFVYDEEVSYILAFTDGYCRFFDNGAATLQETIAISAITNASQCVVTTSGNHGYNNGDEIYIAGVEGMPELNNRFFTVAAKTATTFKLADVSNVNYIDSTGYGAYTSGGDVSVVRDIPSPYGVEDLPYLKHAQKAKSVYFVDGNREPQLLSFDTGTDQWLFAPYTRTADPFTRTITNISNGSPRVVTISAVQGYETDEVVYLRNISGATELNDRAYRVDWLTSTTFTLRDFETDAVINAGNAWTSGGLVAFQNDQPRAVGFYGGRLWFGGTANDPNVFWGSRGPDDKGVPRYDDFTRGSNADDSIRFTIQSQNDTIESIRFFAGTPKFLSIGSLGGIYKVTGSTGDGSAITNTSIYAQPVDYIGVADKAPAFVSSELFYIQLGSKVVNQFGFDFYKDAYTSKELSLFANEMTIPGVVELARQRWVSDLLWCVLEDGTMAVMSSKANENQAWSRVSMTNGKILSACSEATASQYEGQYVVVERTIDGQTVRYVEYMSTDPVTVRREPLLTADKDSDEYAFALMTQHYQRQYCRMDSALKYDGTQATTLSISDTTFTAGSATFAATDVGRLITVASPTGYERGLAKITAYTSSTVVTCEVQEAFSASSFASGEWELSTDELVGADHLEGQTVRILADGGNHSDVVVSGGKIQLDDQYFYVIAGLGYRAVAVTNPIEFVIDNAGSLGVGHVTTIGQIAFGYRNTCGFKFGLDPYDLTESEEFMSQEYNTLPPLIRTGIGKETAFAGYEKPARLWIVKEDALPADILTIHCYGTVGGL